MGPLRIGQLNPFRGGVWWWIPSMDPSIYSLFYTWFGRDYNGFLGYPVPMIVFQCQHNKGGVYLKGNSYKVRQIPSWLDFCPVTRDRMWIGREDFEERDLKEIVCSTRFLGTFSMDFPVNGAFGSFVQIVRRTLSDRPVLGYM
ncbi:hypothetical protein NPIL_51951 [Nephila pilipes]|uniref:Uncharacterized protein n=1 Tax=Nephila pilipes TaxID=299642 RepID=A0A8X6PDJ2_NEPPI|nr:hypothetical protein NPIL_51951 [Nephila pilipes]